MTRYRQRLDKSYLVDFDGRRAGIDTRVFWDLSNVKALQEDVDIKAARARADYQAGLVSINEARAETGRKPIPGGDEIPALVKEEAAKRALEEPNPSNLPPGGKKPNTKPGKKNDDDPTRQVKTYQFEGLQLSRKPKEHERKTIVQLASDQDRAREIVTHAILQTRKPLYEQALKQLQLTDGVAIAFDLDPDLEKQLVGALAEAYQIGFFGFEEESKAIATQPAGTSAVREIFKWMKSALFNTIGGRFLSEFGRRRMRGLALDEAINDLKATFNQESPAVFEELATGAAYQALSDGRKTAAGYLGFDRVIYSALLDTNLCRECKKADGLESTDPDLLPPVPNPQCEGRWRCRCVHVFVRD